MPFSGETGTVGREPNSIDVFVARWDTAGVVQSNTCGHEGDGDRIHANIDPSLIGEAEVEVERQSEKKAPCSHGSLTTGHRRVVESRPCVVDDQATEPVHDRLLLIDGLRTQGDEASTSSDEDGVAKNFVVEAISGIAECGVGGFKGEQAAPRNVVGRVNHAKHVQHGQHQAPKANAYHNGRIQGHLSRGGLGGRIVAHGPCDLRTAFKHTETADHRTKP